MQVRGFLSGCLGSVPARRGDIGSTAPRRASGIPNPNPEPGSSATKPEKVFPPSPFLPQALPEIARERLSAGRFAGLCKSAFVRSGSIGIIPENAAPLSARLRESWAGQELPRAPRECRKRGEGARGERDGGSGSAEGGEAPLGEDVWVGGALPWGRELEVLGRQREDERREHGAFLAGHESLLISEQQRERPRPGWDLGMTERREAALGPLTPLFLGFSGSSRAL